MLPLLAPAEPPCPRAPTRRGAGARAGRRRLPVRCRSHPGASYVGARAAPQVLLVHHRSELGGAPASLSYLIRELDRERFEPHIYCPPGPAAELFREAGAIVHTGPVAGFTHIWASTYRGRRWLLFARELAPLPAHALRSSGGRCGGDRFELVHFNDSPLIPAAWLARREGLPVVWHLRSALPDGGHGPPLGAVRAAIRRLATTLDRDQPRRRGRLRRRLDGRPELGRPRALPARRPRGGEGRARAARRSARSSRSSASSTRRRASASSSRRPRGCATRGIDASYLIVGGAVRGEEFFRTVVGRGAPARRPDARLRVRGEAARRRARARRTSSASSRSRRTPPNLYQASRRRRRAVAGARSSGGR